MRVNPIYTNGDKKDMDLLKEVRIVPDFPKKGIQFYDITSVLQNPEAFKETVDKMCELIETVDCDVIACLEARGFLFASAIAYKLGKSLIPIRKKGKLPYETVSAEFELEYGTDTLEMHKDAVKKGQKVVIVDDLLATGGTLEASSRLVETLGGVVSGVVCFIEFDNLGGREKLGSRKVMSVTHTVVYE